MSFFFLEGGGADAKTGSRWDGGRRKGHGGDEEGEGDEESGDDEAVVVIHRTGQQTGRRASFFLEPEWCRSRCSKRTVDGLVARGCDGLVGGAESVCYFPRVG